MPNELATTTPGQLASYEASSLQNVMSIIERASKDPSVDIDKMERLLAMAERMEAKNRETQFNIAFAELQSEMPVIVAQTEIPKRGKYEKYEDIIQKDGVGELLKKHRFSVSFTQELRDDRVFVTCHLSHGGHTISNTFGVRVGGNSDSTTQADCKASTTAKRNAFLQSLNIVIRQDCLTNEEDPHIEGGEISSDEAASLRERVKTCKVKEDQFLEYAQAESYEAITRSNYERVDEWLTGKEIEKGIRKKDGTFPF